MPFAIGRQWLARFSSYEFATFWQGALDPITFTCIASFPYYGAKLRLYTYDLEVDAPSGVEVADAREIVRDTTLVNRYIADGRIAFSKFSNLFRYTLIQKTGLCWVDADLLCLKRPDFGADAIVFGRQLEPSHCWSINSAVLKLPSNSKILSELIERSKEVVDLDQPWGIIGPGLLTELAKKYRIDNHAHGIECFYPVPSDDFWMPLFPAYYQTVVQKVMSATFLHLWHNSFIENRYDKTSCPPVGSFFHRACEKIGTADRFARIHSEHELRVHLSACLPQQMDLVDT